MSYLARKYGLLDITVYNHALGRLEKAGNLEFHGETIINHNFSYPRRHSSMFVWVPLLWVQPRFFILLKLLGCFLLSRVNSIGFAVLCMYTAIWDDAKRPPYGCLLVALRFTLKTLYLVLNLQYIYIYLFVCVCAYILFLYRTPDH